MSNSKACSNSKVLLATLHAKYSHASLALPYLAVACSDMPGFDTVIREWTVNEPRQQILRLIMSEKADLIAFSCYIWNIEMVLQLASDIKKIAPDTVIVLGGPEASFGVFALMKHNPAIDYVVKGEGETVFRKLLEELFLHSGHGSISDIENLFSRDGEDILAGPLCKSYLDLNSVPSPFAAGLVDMSKPLIYYETSRGCPFSCAFCLSSLEGQVRSFSMERIESDLRWLMERNTGQVKLVDRTFNYDARRASQIWQFILANNRSSHFHFEIAADLLTEENLAVLRQVPPDTFRFEIGVQSTSQDTLAKVERKADLQRIFENVRRLRSQTNIELHLDLVAGLPGEDYPGLLHSLQQISELKPHVIQIEPLKVLKGSAMREIAAREGYNYSETPPYTILSTPRLTYDEICRIEIVGRLLDLFHNNGGFGTALAFMDDKLSFSELLDRLAQQAENENLSGRTTRRLYELFASLAGSMLSDAERPLLHDALFFDYCLCEMPLQGKLPSFVADRQQQCSWPGRRDLPEGLDLPVDSRIKMFRFVFENDYRAGVRTPGPATVSFVYSSGEGRGLKVLTV